MNESKMDPAMHCGVVRLTVRDLERSLAYYQTGIGLGVLDRGGEKALLGAGDTPLLELTEQPGALPIQRGRTGLYHFALLTPDRPALCPRARSPARETPIDGASGVAAIAERGALSLRTPTATASKFTGIARGVSGPLPKAAWA